jgi:hypothetical protein
VAELGGAAKPVGVSIWVLLLMAWIAALARRRGWRWTIAWLVATVAVPLALLLISKPVAALVLILGVLYGVTVAPALA